MHFRQLIFLAFFLTAISDLNQKVLIRKNNFTLRIRITLTYFGAEIRWRAFLVIKFFLDLAHFENVCTSKTGLSLF
jgi:hypothetical protein